MALPQRLVVTDLCKSYGTRRVVDTLSFSLEPGEVLGLLGPNGAGKTTAVEMLYGAVKPTAGTARLMPSGAASSSAAAMHHIGVVTQSNNLDPDFDVLTNLQLFGMYHALPKEVTNRRAQQLLTDLALSEYAHHRIDQLSGGLERRVVLARALIADPQFIFLDEPTTGFDPDMRQLFWRSILALRDAGKSILLTTHYMDEAQRLCDRLLVLRNGKVLDEGSPQQLITRWIGTDVVEVEGLTAAQVGQELHGVALLQFARGYIACLPSSFTPSASAALYQTLEAAGATHLSIRRATLEDVFLALQQGAGLPSAAEQAS